MDGIRDISVINLHALARHQQPASASVNQAPSCVYKNGRRAGPTRRGEVLDPKARSGIGAGQYDLYWFVYRYIVWVSYVAAKIYEKTWKTLIPVDRSISKADQLRPQHPWITTCWNLGVGKYTLGASQNYKSSSQNLLETRRQQTVNSEILVRSPTSKILRSVRRLSWKSLSFCSSFIWYCPSLHVMPVEWNAWGSSQNMVASDPKEAWTKRRSESQSDQAKTWVLWGIQWISSCFFFTLEPLNGWGIDFQRDHEQFQRWKPDIVLLPFLVMKSWVLSDFIEYQHWY